MKKKLMPVLAAVIFALIVMLIAFSSALLKKYTPTKERVNLNEYYNLVKEDPSAMAIVLDNVILDESCKQIDEQVYLSYELVKQEINSRFYWDYNENIMRYSLPNDIITVSANSNEYTVSKQKESQEYTIVKVEGDKMYIAIDFVKQYTNIEYKIHKNPDRVLITKTWGEFKNATIKKDTQIRVKGGIKSPIVADLAKGAAVTILEENETWDKVASEDGYIGYLKNKSLNEKQTNIKEKEFEEPVFSHLLKEDAVSLAWHQVTTMDANDNVTELLKNTKGINVLSPTWFYLDDNDGNIQNLASIDYVNYCHQNGIEVWALISNLENPEASAEEVLNHTSKRDNLVNKIMAAAIEYDLDGINLDFESLSAEAGDGYIQLVRELSVKCRKNNIVLSIDNYVPTEYTAFYNRKEQAVFADYVIIMGYDEHYKGSETEGSVASIDFVRNGVHDTLKEVPAEQVILAMPFYTRIWEVKPDDEAEAGAPSVQNKTDIVSSTAVGMVAAEDAYLQYGAEKQWLKDMGQYYVEYQNNGLIYKIWLEDEASIEEKCKIVKENALAGAAYWKLGLEKQSIWDILIKYMN